MAESHKTPEVTPAMLEVARTAWIKLEDGKEVRVPPETATLLWGLMWQAYAAARQ